MEKLSDKINNQEGTLMSNLLDLIKGKKFEYTQRQGVVRDKTFVNVKKVYQIQGFYIPQYRGEAKIQVVYDNGKKATMKLRGHLNDRLVETPTKKDPNQRYLFPID